MQRRSRRQRMVRLLVLLTCLGGFWMVDDATVGGQLFQMMRKSSVLGERTDDV